MIEFDNTYGLTDAEREAVNKDNKRRGYGLADEDIVELAKRFKAAYKTLGKILYQLEDLNFHTEAAMLEGGEFDELIKNPQAGTDRIRVKGGEL